MTFYPVRLGTGKKVHAATADEIQKGRHMIKVYRQLCGSGKSTLAHSYHNPSIRPDYHLTIADVNCEKCLEIINV